MSNAMLLLIAFGMGFCLGWFSWGLDKEKKEALIKLIRGWNK